MSQASSKRVELSNDDVRRVHRLTEEVQGRLEEMARITGRVLGLPVNSHGIRKFVPIEQVAFDLPSTHHIEIFDLPDGTSWCLVFLDGGGAVAEFPCGGAG